MKLRNMVAPVVFGALSLAVANAHAADLGTDAGTEITNTASLTYAVNGSNQSVSAAVKVDVDLKLDFKLTTNSTAPLSTSLPSDPAVTEIAIASLKLKNDSNAPVSYSIDIIDRAITSPDTLYSRTDNFNLTTPTYTVTATGGATVNVVDGSIEVTKLPEDGTTDITVKANKTSFAGQLNGASFSIFDFEAKATKAFDDDNAEITVTANSAGGKDNDLTTVQVVWADAGKNNSESTSDAVSLTLPYFPSGTNPTTDGFVKTSEVVWDPINKGNGDDKAIPGATVKYTIVVRNKGTATATGLTVTDTLPSQVDYCVDTDKGCAAVSLKNNSGAAITNGASESSGVITAPNLSIAASEKVTIEFFATIK